MCDHLLNMLLEVEALEISSAWFDLVNMRGWDVMLWYFYFWATKKRKNAETMRSKTVKPDLSITESIMSTHTAHVTKK